MAGRHNTLSIKTSLFISCRHENIYMSVGRAGADLEPSRTFTMGAFL